ncbi:MAG: helix-turn-helix transcriptional regulator [Burkholderiaceae bacterium]|nr:helix-turn-helix transcriptional regulator [Burkholderiaceae bacterium]
MASNPDWSESVGDTGPQAEQPVATLVSRCLLDLYQLAIGSRIGEFEDQLFTLVGEYVAFDGAWFGRSTMMASGPIMHNNYTCDLGDDFVSDWERVKADDPLVSLVTDERRNPAIVSMADDLSGPFRSFCGKYDLAQLMCSVAVDPVLKLWTHLSLYRNGLVPRYSERDIEMMRHLMPHFAAALNLNRVHHVERMQMAAQGPRTAVAICDGRGVIQYADSAFADLMLMEWPQWGGGTLPANLNHALLVEGVAAFVGTYTTLRAERIADLFVIQARPPCALDLLTPKELSVVRLFGEGLTYKAVARRLGNSPATVRHHLRRAYAKLRIQNKGEIAWLLNAPEVTNPARADGSESADRSETPSTVSVKRRLRSV